MHHEQLRACPPPVLPATCQIQSKPLHSVPNCSSVWAYIARRYHEAKGRPRLQLVLVYIARRYHEAKGRPRLQLVLVLTLSTEGSQRTAVVRLAKGNIDDAVTTRLANVLLAVDIWVDRGRNIFAAASVGDTADAGGKGVHAACLMPPVVWDPDHIAGLRREGSHSHRWSAGHWEWVALIGCAQEHRGRGWAQARTSCTHSRVVGVLPTG